MKQNVTAIFILLICTTAGYTQNSDKQILFFGDSITAGHGIDENNAFPALIQEKIDSLGWSFEVQNAGLSGETSAGGLRRVDWILQQPVDVFVLELGGNDGLRGIDPQETKTNLQQIMDKVKETYPDAHIVLAGMQVPPNMGSQYAEEFKNIYSELAEENEVTFIPFLLEGVGGNSELNQSDGIHPTAEGHEVMAETVWENLRPILENIR